MFSITLCHLLPLDRKSAVFDLGHHTSRRGEELIAVGNAAAARCERLLDAFRANGSNGPLPSRCLSWRARCRITPSVRMGSERSIVPWMIAFNLGEIISISGDRSMRRGMSLLIPSGGRAKMGSGRGAERSSREWGRFGGERGAASSGSRGSWGSAER